MIKFLNIFIAILISLQVEAQESVSSKMIQIELQTIEGKTNDIISASITDLFSGGERIGIVHGDYDGISIINICSKKIIDEQITLKVYGIKCVPFEKEYTIVNDSKLTIHLEYGETKYQTLEDRRFILSELKILLCDIEIIEFSDEAIYYQHCDGRIKRKDKIPSDTLLGWERININKK